jgi:O-antigen/teichoic acid export membrane protein
MNKSPFLINFFSLNLSSFFIKILNFILFIALVHYLSVKEYGIYIIVWAQVNLFTPLLDFGTTSYGLVYLSKGEKKKIYTLFSMRFFISLVTFVITLVSVFIYGPGNSISLFIFLTSFSIFSNTWFGSHMIIASLKQKAYRASVVSFISTFILVASCVTALVFTKNITVLFSIVGIFYFLYAVANFLFVRKEIGGFRFVFDKVGWLHILKNSYIFVLIAFLSELYFKQDVFLLKWLQSDHAVGTYSAGYKFYEALMFLVSSYVLSVTPVLSDLAKKGKKYFMEKFKKDFVLLTILGTAVATAMYFVAPFILPFILKEDAVASATVLRTVIWALPFMLVSTLFYTTFYVFRKAYVVIGLFTVQLVLNFILNFWFIPQYSFMASAYITVLNEVLNLSICILLFIYFRKRFTYENID